MPDTDFRALLQPTTLAIAGVSARRRSLGTALLEHLVDFGFAGSLYVLHPTASEVAGVPARPSLAGVPGGVDCTVVTLPAEQVPAFVRENGSMTRFVHVLSGGFAEAGAADLEAELVAAAAATGTRLVGPNCLGTYSPAAGLTFVDGAPREPGPVALVSQSGGLATDVIRRGGVRGLRFSSVVTAGNCADVTVEELAGHFASDASTGCVAMYVERIADGERFLHALSRLVPQRPAVVLRGGLTASGQRSASSHTGSMSTPARVWDGLCRQAGIIAVDCVEDLVDVLVALQHRRRPVGRRLALFGTGGGASVLAADAAERAGFDLPAFDSTTQASLVALGIGPGSSLGNPVDTPAGALAADGGRVAGAIVRRLLDTGPDLLLTHLNLHPFGAFTEGGERLAEGIVRALAAESSDAAESALVLRSTGEVEIEALKDRFRRIATGAGTAVFDSVGAALRAYRAVRDFDERWERRARQNPPRTSG